MDWATLEANLTRLQAHLRYEAAEQTRLREENRRLDEIARAAAAWCSEHPDEGTPLLRDLLHAHGYDPRPREPDPDVWLPGER